MSCENSQKKEVTIKHKTKQDRLKTNQDNTRQNKTRQDKYKTNTRQIQDKHKTNTRQTRDKHETNTRQTQDKRKTNARQKNKTNTRQTQDKNKTFMREKFTRKKQKKPKKTICEISKNSQKHTKAYLLTDGKMVKRKTSRGWNKREEQADERQRLDERRGSQMFFDLQGGLLKLMGSEVPNWHQCSVIYRNIQSFAGLPSP